MYNEHCMLNIFNIYIWYGWRSPIWERENNRLKTGPCWSLSVTWLGDPKVVDRSGPRRTTLSGILAKQKMNTPKLEVQLLLLAGHGRL